MTGMEPVLALEFLEHKPFNLMISESQEWLSERVLMFAKLILKKESEQIINKCIPHQNTLCAKLSSIILAVSAKGFV